MQQGVSSTAIEQVCLQVRLFSWKLKLGNEGGWTTVSEAAGAATVLFSTMLEKESVFSERPQALVQEDECVPPQKRARRRSE